ncbi:MAG: alanine racemase [Treponema sp.]|jgi:alanine racemase|nr:alanine racemase [Treponema sp.]
MRTMAIIHVDRLAGNLAAIQARVGAERRVCAAVKADGYGHGALPTAQACQDAGAYCLAVATIGEGAELRKGGITTPILLLSQPDFNEIPAIFDAKLTPFVSDAEYASALIEYAKTAKTKLAVHIKIDTGMRRIGCHAEEAANLAKTIANSVWLELGGIATHLAVSDSAAPQDIEFTRKQLAVFNEAVQAVRASDVDPGIVHAANSGAIILHPEAWLDMVRPGISLYGYKMVQEAEVPGFPLEPLRVEPVMELRSTVVLIKKIKRGETVSYGRTWTAGRDTNIAVLPVGYADGFPRLASGRWQAYIKGRAYPLAGRICMDQCVIDAGPETEVKRWDEAVIFGGCAPSAADLAKLIGTIPYEITCNINKRVPRVYE